MGSCILPDIVDSVQVTTGSVINSIPLLSYLVFYFLKLKTEELSRQKTISLRKNEHFTRQNSDIEIIVLIFIIQIKSWMIIQRFRVIFKLYTYTRCLFKATGSR